MKNLLHLTSTLGCAALLAACSADNDSGTNTEPNPDTGVTADVIESELDTYHGAVRAVLERNCVSCHTEGGAGPFPLDTFESASANAELSLASIESGSMPPWSPDPDCREYEYERIMRPDEIELLRQWIDAGKPEGEPATYVAPEIPTPPEFNPDDAAGVPEPYTPQLENADDYRCFILDMEFPEDAYITGSTVVPGNELVHHVLVYALDGDNADTARELDAAEDGVGYTCFGGPIPIGEGEERGLDSLLNGGVADGFPNQVGAWVPGQVPATLPEGMARRVTAGSILVMQIHYSVVAGDPRPDGETEFQVEFTDTQPEFLSTTRPLANLGIEIEAGDPESTHEMSLPYYSLEPIEIRGLTAHMHLLGRGMTFHLEHDDASETCGLDVPDYDFDWQQQYVTAANDQLVLTNGDRVRMTCTYDNSAGNQPVVNGEQLEPRDVDWGDGTLDEMCLLYLDTVSEYEPAPEASCPQSCIDTCGDDPTMACLSSCSDDALGCVTCGLGQAFDCGAIACTATIQANVACFSDCLQSSIFLGGNFGLCMENECPDGYAELLDCVEPVLASCDTGLEACLTP